MTASSLAVTDVRHIFGSMQQTMQAQDIANDVDWGMEH